MNGSLLRYVAVIVSAAVIAILCMAALSIHASRSAAAHANQLRSSPSPSQELESAPERVIIWFTEPVESQFSLISVLDSAGRGMTLGDTEFDPTEPQAMWVLLDELPNGTYTVVWRNVSSIDGHKVSGSFLFAVGESIGAGAQSLTGLEQPLLQARTDPFIRWAIYIGMAMFFGGLLFELVIANRVVESLGSESDTLSAVRGVSRVFGIVASISILAAMIAQLAQLAQQAAIAFDTPWTGLSVPQAVDVVTQTEWGFYWGLRAVAAVVAGVMIVLAYRAVALADHQQSGESDEDGPILMTESMWGVLAMSFGALYLALISFSSHNAATPDDVQWIAISADIIHIVTASVWVGGIGYLAISAIVLGAVSESGVKGREVMASLASRFTPLAVLAVAAIVGSGIVSALMQVTIRAAIGTPYGWTLVVKIVLLIPLIAVAGYNMLVVTRRSIVGSSATATLRKTVLIESAVAILILLAAAWLASLEPARQYAERNGIGIQNAVVHTDSIDGANIEATLEPGQVGSNTLRVRLTDNRGEAFTHVEEIRARIKYLDDDFAEPYLPIAEVDAGVWEEEGAQISIAGAYQAEISIVRSDAFDSHTSFRFSARSASFASDIIRPELSESLSLFGLQILIIGVAVIVSGWLRRRYADELETVSSHRVGAMPVVAGALCVAVGAVIAVNAVTVGIGIPQDALQNPFPLTQQSIQEGNVAYAATCASCHGESGRGDGPAASGLNPMPADLAVHVPLHTDADLYDFIANGIPNTAMAPQKDNLTQDQIWHLVNHLRTIRE